MAGKGTRKTTPAHEDAIYALKSRKMSSARVAEHLAAGYGNLPPIELSRASVTRIYRKVAEARGTLYESQLGGLETDEAIKKLTDRMLRLAEREVIKLEAAQFQGKLDGNRVAKMAAALERIHKLSRTIATAPPLRPPKPNGDGDGQEPSAEPASPFAAQIAREAGREPPEPMGAEVADVVVTPNGKVPGGAVQPVPSSDDGTGEEPPSTAGWPPSEHADLATDLDAARRRSELHAVPDPPEPPGPGSNSLDRAQEALGGQPGTLEQESEASGPATGSMTGNLTGPPIIAPNADSADQARSPEGGAAGADLPPIPA